MGKARMDSTPRKTDLEAQAAWGLVVWARVVLACSLAWFAALIIGFLTLTAAEKLLCPKDQIVSGNCEAPWFVWVERVVMFGSAAMAGALVVWAAALIAGRWRRRRAADMSFLVGSVCAVYICITDTEPELWALGMTSIVGGWLARWTVNRWTRTQ